MNADLTEMMRVTRLVLDAELAKLRTIGAEVDGFRAAIAELDRDVRTRARHLANLEADDSARLAGRDGPWLGWVARQRRSLTGAMADAAARRETQRVVARRAFGRVEALTGLKRLEAAQLRQDARRRAIGDTGAPQRS